MLVVDDDKDTRDALVDVLGHFGCTVLTAGNGVEALEVLKKGQRPDAMLVDLDMPLMDGRVFGEACDAEPELAAIPRVVLTANPYAAFYLSRARMIIDKPFDPKRVVEALAMVCDVMPVAA